MKKIFENKVLFAVFWIVLYVVTVNISDLISEAYKLDYLTTICVLLFAVSLSLYILISKTKLIFESKNTSKNTSVLIYIPLFIIGLIQLTKGIDDSLSKESIITVIGLMIGVGFIEEIIFRGFLLKAIGERSSVIKTIIISGVTFGAGHIVNLSRGYEYNELIAQIIVAIVIGVFLSLLVVITKKIYPGVIFHIIFNITGSITSNNEIYDWYILLFILLITIPVCLYLFRIIKRDFIVSDKKTILVEENK
ncbi:MAG: CPBP family intramembrane glutamic endopeptidase [Bacilli bacterium]